MLRRVIFSSLYAPHAKFHSFAQALSDLRRGSGEALYAMYAAGRPPFDCACDDSDGMTAFEEVEDGGWAVACNDAAPGRSPKGYDAFVRHYEEMRRASSFADIWGQLRSGCVAWPEYQRSQFRGPFNMNTSFPLLVVGNTADPVTPLWAAKNMARSFGNLALLVQDSTGHCSISAPSLCAARHIQAYFKDGKLPPEGTVCKPDFDVFPRTDIATMEGHSQAMLSILPALSVEEKRMVDVLRRLSTDGLVSPVF
ncbi:AB hydrolase-1 domain-containing protein [Mycena kentingensis (nom. inval.)]|nr:AB hydrolase-1 domain-containing protein [Mycena kentingensis (nom. inval.)]